MSSPLWLDAGGGADLAAAVRELSITDALIPGAQAARDGAFDEGVLRAAQALFAAHQDSNGSAGYVAVPLPACSACSADKLDGEASSLFRDAGLKNVMPALYAGAEAAAALRSLTAAGVPVMVLGAASLTRLDELWEAYLKGLEDRAKADMSCETCGLAAGLAVGRIDAALDGVLRERMLSAPIETIRAAYRLMIGRIGASAAKAASWRMRRTFNSVRFNRLAAFGARAPRLIWQYDKAERLGGLPVCALELCGVDCGPLFAEAEARVWRCAPRKETVGENASEARMMLDKLANYQLDLDRLAEGIEGAAADAEAAP